MVSLFWETKENGNRDIDGMSLCFRSREAIVHGVMQEVRYVETGGINELENGELKKVHWTVKKTSTTAWAVRMEWFGTAELLGIWGNYYHRWTTQFMFY
jgi:hypothetical protein